MKIRKYLGACVYDLLPFVHNTWIRSGTRRLPGWARNANRNDQILVGPGDEGVICDWEHTRDLHITNVFPYLSAPFLRKTLRDWPVRLLAEPASGSDHHGTAVDVTFVIGHRGTSRLNHLLLTLQSIAGQSEVSFECIVIEQSFQQELPAHLPAWVRYEFTRTPSHDYLYNRSWALNAGVKLASGKLVVLHDGDMLLPAEYGAECMRQFQRGFDVVNLKRFICYLNQDSTNQIFRDQALTGPLRSEHVVANLCAGGSLSVSRNAYWMLGGMDEEFVGWGGEDTEFWDRCQTLRVARHGYLPIVHLWHPGQPGKAEIDGLGATTAALYRSRMQLTREERIQSLRARQQD